MLVFPLYIFSEGKLLDDKVVLFMVFTVSSMLFSIVVIPIHSPTHRALGVPFSTSMPAFVISCFSDDGHSNRPKILPYCGCDLRVPNDVWYQVSFHVPVDLLYIFFGETSIQVLCKFLSWVIWVFFCLSYMSSLYFWVIKLFIRYMVCKYFVTSYRFYFHFVNGFCCSAGACSCDVGPLVYFLSSSLCFRYYIQKIITKTRSKNRIPVFSSKKCHGLDLPVKPLSIFFSTSI